MPDGPLEVYLNQELGDALLWLRTPGAWRVPKNRVALPLEQLADRKLRVAGPLKPAGTGLSGPALVVSTGATAKRLAGLAKGSELTLTQSGADANTPQLVVGTGPRLLKEGQVPASLRENPADAAWLLPVPRTAIGYDAKSIYLVATLQTTGLSLTDFGAVLAWLGCREAVNLDGGPSTSMWAKGHAGVNGPYQPEVATSVLVLPKDGDGIKVQ